MYARKCVLGIQIRQQLYRPTDLSIKEKCLIRFQYCAAESTSKRNLHLIYSIELCVSNMHYIQIKSDQRDFSYLSLLDFLPHQFELLHHFENIKHSILNITRNHSSAVREP